MSMFWLVPHYRTAALYHRVFLFELRMTRAHFRAPIPRGCACLAHWTRSLTRLPLSSFAITLVQQLQLASKTVSCIFQSPPHTGAARHCSAIVTAQVSPNATQTLLAPSPQLLPRSANSHHVFLLSHFFIESFLHGIPYTLRASNEKFACALCACVRDNKNFVLLKPFTYAHKL